MDRARRHFRHISAVFSAPAREEEAAIAAAATLYDVWSREAFLWDPIMPPLPRYCDRRPQHGACGGRIPCHVVAFAFPYPPSTSYDLSLHTGDRAGLEQSPIVLWGLGIDQKRNQLATNYRLRLKVEESTLCCESRTRARVSTLGLARATFFTQPSLYHSAGYGTAYAPRQVRLISLIYENHPKEGRTSK